MEREGAKGISDDAFDAVLDEFDMEVDEQTEAATGQCQVRQHLGTVDGEEGINHFECDHRAIFCQKIQPQPGIDGDIGIPHRQHGLAFKIDPCRSNSLAKTLLVYARQ